MTRMPTSYTLEKATALGRISDLIHDPFVDTWDPCLSEIRHLAQSIIDEIDKWRNQ